MGQPFSSQITRQKSRCDPRDGSCARTPKSVGRAHVLRKASRAFRHPRFASCCARFTGGCGGVVGFQRIDWSVFNRWLISVTLPGVETSIEQRVIELRYAGVVIGKATVSGPIDESGDKSVFVPVPDPVAGRDQGRNQDRRPHAGRACDRRRRIDRLGEVRHEDPHRRRGCRRDIGVRARERACAVGARGRLAPGVAPAAGAPSAPAPSAESAPVDGAVVAEGDVDVSAAHGDSNSDGVPGTGDGGGPSGAQGGGGGRRRRRRR